jgi:hypothetical protein
MRGSQFVLPVTILFRENLQDGEYLWLLRFLALSAAGLWRMEPLRPRFYCGVIALHIERDWSPGPWGAQSAYGPH